MENERAVLPRDMYKGYSTFSQTSVFMKDFILSHLNTNKATDDKVNSTCHDHGRLFVIMDSLFLDFYSTRKEINVAKVLEVEKKCMTF